MIWNNTRSTVTKKHAKKNHLIVTTMIVTQNTIFCFEKKQNKIARS